MAVIVNFGAPPSDDAAPAASPLLNPTVQVSRAPAELRGVQLTDETPVPIVAAVALTPAGSWSATVAAVAEVVPPSFPRLRV